MKILHVTDLHGNLPWYNWLTREAPNYDLVCISGDLIDQNDAVPQQITDVSRFLESIRTPMAVCSGNHDVAPDGQAGAFFVSTLKREGVWIDGERFELGPHRFYCHPWNEPIPHAERGEIWIIHAPPEWSVVSWGGSLGEQGDHEFAQVCRAMRGPRIALCGHAHRPPAWNARSGATHVFNPGHSDDVRVPAHIVLDLVAGVATRHWPGRPPATAVIGSTSARDILRKRSPRELEQLLDLAVKNQEAEGYILTAEERAEVWQRIRKLMHFGDE